MEDCCEHIKELLDNMKKNGLVFVGDTQVCGIECKRCGITYGII